jgi:hypothetical protein
MRGNFSVPLAVLLLLIASGAGFPQDVPHPDIGVVPNQSPTSRPSPPPTATSGRPEAQPLAKLLRENWRQLMLRTPAPNAGCYTSAFPSTTWQETRCSTEPARPHPRLLHWEGQ